MWRAISAALRLPAAARRDLTHNTNRNGSETRTKFQLLSLETPPTTTLKKSVLLDALTPAPYHAGYTPPSRRLRCAFEIKRMPPHVMPLAAAALLGRDEHSDQQPAKGLAHVELSAAAVAPLDTAHVTPTGRGDPRSTRGPRPLHGGRGGALSARTRLLRPAHLRQVELHGGVDMCGRSPRLSQRCAAAAAAARRRSTRGLGARRVLARPPRRQFRGLLLVEGESGRPQRPEPCHPHELGEVEAAVAVQVGVLHCARRGEREE